MKFIEKYVLAIDAGATKTAAAIGTQQTIIGHGKSGPGNMHVVTPKQFTHNFQAAVKIALQKAKLPKSTHFSSIVVGMAGIDAPVDETQAKTLVHQAVSSWISSQTRVNIMNDVFIVLRSGTHQPFGIAQISGTGSHALGINPKGETVRVGGVGFLLDDAGSGWNIGISGLRLAVRSWDGRTKPTLLQDLLLQHFKVHNWRDIIPYVRNANKADIAKISYVVEQAAKQGDPQAKHILQDNINELLLNAEIIVKKLKMRRTHFDIVIAGGMFNMQGYPYLKKYIAGIKKIAPLATVITTPDQPVVGAVRLAQDML